MMDLDEYRETMKGRASVVPTAPTVNWDTGEPMKTCDRCRRSLPLTKFWRNVNAEDGLQQMCKDCHAKNQRENHNIAPDPPKRRRSPYDRIRVALQELESVAQAGSTFDVVNKINDIRTELKL